MGYLLLKSLHLIFMVSYFAGLFYLVRIFVYYKDTDDMEEGRRKILREQYVFMARRLWNIITVPAGVLMAIFGLSMLGINSDLLTTGWFHLKLLFLLGLAGYHYWSWKMVLRLKNLPDESLSQKNVFLRQMNEVATLLLFLIVFTVILKGQVLIYGWQLLAGFLVFMVVIMGIVKLVNRSKIKNKV